MIDNILATYSLCMHVFFDALSTNSKSYNLIIIVLYDIALSTLFDFVHLCSIVHKNIAEKRGA